MNLFDKLISYYHINVNDYEFLKRDANDGDVLNYKTFENIEKAASLIKEAATLKKKILIYGDYDADGILATTILFLVLREINALVDYYIPSRYLDGYGLTSDKVQQAYEKGYQLIITVDNGVKAVEACELAKSLNLDLIITDHHDYQSIPPCLAFLHPKLSQLNVTTSGAMVAFYLSCAILNRIDPYLLVLGGTSIIADVMPLTHENRQIVKLAIKYLNKNKFDAFNLLSGSYLYDETTLANYVIPKINAVGRICQNKEVNLLVKYFTSKNYRELINIRDYINNINEKRKELANDALVKTKINVEEASICLKLNILNGLSGLIANRFLMQYNKPTVIFADDTDENLLRASFRSKNGLNVMEFINDNANLFLESGGHAQAAGATIKNEDFAVIKDKFNLFAVTHPFKQNADNIPITLSDLTFANYELIRSFAPFGEGWREPSFILKDVPTNLIKRIGRNQEHLCIEVADQVKVVGFNFPFHQIQNQSQIDLIGKWRINKYKNTITLNFVLENQ